ncbi:MAG: endonuclease III [Candidatus Dadabacteria bacterium]|nr:endonuclease III [Candidatus Dadabacteria bacterium]
MTEKIDRNNIAEVLGIIREQSAGWNVPVVTLTAVSSKSPFRVLISTVLSLRTKDETTAQASERLFREASTPRTVLELGENRVRNLIYPVGFYRVKAQNIISICEKLIGEYDGEVPDSLDELLKFRGVGRKTANLVLSLGYGKFAICVDIHVHRISNRWGYVDTENPYETEMALQEKLPRKYWIEYNSLLVALGQQICRPVSPLCSRCPLSGCCPKRGVSRSR